MSEQQSENSMYRATGTERYVKLLMMKWKLKTEKKKKKKAKTRDAIDEHK